MNVLHVKFGCLPGHFEHTWLKHASPSYTMMDLLLTCTRLKCRAWSKVLLSLKPIKTWYLVQWKKIQYRIYIDTLPRSEEHHLPLLQHQRKDFLTLTPSKTKLGPEKWCFSCNTPRHWFALSQKDIILFQRPIFESELFVFLHGLRCMSLLNITFSQGGKTSTHAFQAPF